MIPGLSGSLLSHEALSAGAGLRLVQPECGIRGGPSPAACLALDDRPRDGAGVRRPRGLRSGRRTAGRGARIPRDACRQRHGPAVPCGARGARRARGRLAGHRTGAASRRARGETPSVTASREASAGASASTAPRSGCSTPGAPTPAGFAEFDLEAALHDPVGFGVFWGLLRADAFARRPGSAARRCGRDIRAAPRRRPRVAAAGRPRRADLSRARLRRRADAPSCRTASPRALRRIARRHLPHPVSAVRRSARAGAEVASDLSRQLHDRGAQNAGGSAWPGRADCGNRCRPSRGSRTGAAARERCACLRSTDGSSPPRTRRSRNRPRSTTARCGRRCSP